MAQMQVQSPVPVSGTGMAAANGGGVRLSSTSLYVGDLEMNVTDSQLFDLFSQVGQVLFVRVCRDIDTRRPLGYAYVNFGSPVDAAIALKMLNFTPINNKPIRIMFSNRDPSARKSGTNNIFIKNLDKAIDNKALQDTFSVFGNILSCKVATDPSGHSKGYGFVQFDSADAAQNAIDKLNGMLLNDKKVYVGPFLRRQERENFIANTKFSNVFVKNLSSSTTEDDLTRIFGEYGKTTSIVVMRELDGKSKCFGYVNFEYLDDAATAVQELNGKKFDDKEWYVGRAQKKTEREQELKVKSKQSIKSTGDKYQWVNLYLKNLDYNFGDEKLKELFSVYGKITSCKVIRDKNGKSRGLGFVVFSTPEEASCAFKEMNGKMVGSKPLYVGIAQDRRERRARLQAQFSQIQPASLPHVAPPVPMYPPGTPGIGQQLFYQAPPTLVRPQPGFGYHHQQLVTGMRPGRGPMPNFFVPFVQPGQHQCPGGRVGPGPMQQRQQPMPPLLQHQMFPRGGVHRYPPGHAMPNRPLRGVSGGIHSCDMGGMLVRDGPMPQPIPVSSLPSFIANASSPLLQRTMLGKSLYPLVEQMEREHAAKVTGMLLEMDQTEVLHLLESPDALKDKVTEAMEVLRNVNRHQRSANPPIDQMAALSVSDSFDP